jgi:hypothetical protein
MTEEENKKRSRNQINKTNNDEVNGNPAIAK